MALFSVFNPLKSCPQITISNHKALFGWHLLSTPLTICWWRCLGGIYGGGNSKRGKKEQQRARITYKRPSLKELMVSWIITVPMVPQTRLVQ
jgi:hypothetical protein